jgi:purine-binding chemotaxis protein CheW
MAMNGETTLSTIPRVKKSGLPAQTAVSTQVDWDAIHRMVLESSARLTWGDEASQEFVEQAWARRAAKLALAVEEEETEERTEIVVVRLGSEVYGLDTAYVYDIRKLENLTRVPRVPKWVAGVVNLRGRVVSALELPGFLGLPNMESDRQTDERYLVVVETPALEIAILVDEVLAIESLPVSKIQEATSAVRGIRPEYLRGIVVGSQDNRSRERSNGNEHEAATPSQNGNNTSHSSNRGGPSLLVILDLPVLLVDPRLVIHEDII